LLSWEIQEQPMYPVHGGEGALGLRRENQRPNA
jgi:hypothetical protein